MNAKQRRQEERRKMEQREKQRKDTLEYFEKNNIPYLDDGTVIEKVEIVDELEYKKQPQLHQPFFADQLRDFDLKFGNEIFEIGFERPMIFEGEFEVIEIEE